MTDYTILDMFTGVSPKLKNDSILPSIIEFAEHPSFCGKRLYPKQRTFLKLIFLEDYNFTDYDYAVIDDWIEQGKRFTSGAEVLVPDDIYERIKINQANGRTHFREVIEVGGRRGGKGYIGGIIGARKAYEMINLDNPQRFFGLDQDKDLYINVVATSSVQARKYLFADIAMTILGCKALQPYILKVQEEEIRMQTPHDLRKVAELKGAGIKVNKDIASVRVTANSSSSASGRGGAAFMQAFDELAHALDTESSRSASEVYEAYTPSLDQIGTAGIIYVPSSPYTQVGKFYDLYQAGLEKTDDGKPKYPEMLVVQHPSWTMYEDWEFDGRFTRPIQQYDEQMQQHEMRNPEKFKVERRARFANTIDAYLAPEMVDRAFDNDLVLKDRGEWGKIYRFHGDPGKSQDFFCIAGGHVEKRDDGYDHAIIDFMHAWQPRDFPLDPVMKVPWVDYDIVVKEIIGLTKKFKIGTLSFDQFNCLDQNSLIPTVDGLLTIEELSGKLPVGATEDIDIPVQTKDGIFNALQAHHKGAVRTLKFKTKHGVDIYCTPEHRLWVSKKRSGEFEWMRADEITDGMYFQLQLNSVGSKQELNVEELKPKHVFGGSSVPGVSKFADGKWEVNKSNEHTRNGEKRRIGFFENQENAERVAIDYYKSNPSKYSNVRFPETITPQLARVLGLFVSEGSVGSSSSCVGNKDKEVLQLLSDDISSMFGREIEYKYSSELTMPGKDRTYEFGTICVSSMVTRFFKNIGMNTVMSQEKVTPWTIRRSPQHVQASFLSGLFEGDGGVTLTEKHGEWITLFTTSEMLSIEVQQMLHSMGILTTRWEGTYKYKGEKRKQWRVKIHGKDIISFRDKVGFLCSHKKKLLDSACEAVMSRGDRVGRRDKNTRGDNYYFDRIVSVDDGGIRDCYDIAVPEVENFIANGIVCHNSIQAIQTIRKAVRLGKTLNDGTIVKEVTATHKTNWEQFELFKTALYMGLVHMPEYIIDLAGAGMVNLPAEEFKFLQVKGTRVDHQSSGAITSKDMADCIVNVVYDLLHKQMTSILGESASMVIGTNASGSSFMAGDRRDFSSAKEQFGKLHSGRRGRIRP